MCDSDLERLREQVVALTKDVGILKKDIAQISAAWATLTTKLVQPPPTYLADPSTPRQ